MTAMDSRRNTGAFTLVELMVSAAVACFVGLIAFGVASEGLHDFARNISINRSFGMTRASLSRMSVEMQSAGHVPVLVDATGASTTTTPAAGIRFWRYSSTPEYLITTPALTSTTVTISLIQPGTTSTVIGAPLVGDMITIPALGFQAQIVSLTTSGNSAVLTFSGTVAGNTSPTLTTLPSGTLSCLDWVPVAFIAVGTDLRYYPRFIYGTTSISTPSNYHVIANLIAGAALPFTPGSSPTINIDLYTQAVDYNNLDINSANTYNYFQTALAPRNPTLLHTPY